MTRVVAAILCREGRILLGRRAPGKTLAGCWEFPGGKIEPGESPAVALRRELKEELAIDIDSVREWMTTRHVYDFGEIELVAVLARCLTGGDLQSTDHDRLDWVKPEDLLTYNLAPADRPIANILRRRPSPY